MSAAPRIALLPASGHVDMPWKNGLGRTAEIAREPAHGEAFDWRVSIATIAADGAFSAFPGCERTLVPIAGGGLALDFPDGATITGGLFEAMRFPGDVACHGRLLAGAARDLNVITRRAAIRHRLEIVVAPQAVRCDGATTLVVALAPLRISSGTESWTLAALDALRLDGAGTSLRIASDDRAARAAVIALDRGAG